MDPIQPGPQMRPLAEAFDAAGLVDGDEPQEAVDEAVDYRDLHGFEGDDG